MKKFMMGGVLATLSCVLSLSAIAETKAPIEASLVTRDNLVSLEFVNRDRIGDYQTQFAITGNEIRIEEVKSPVSIGSFVGKESPEIMDSFKVDHYEKKPMYEFRPFDPTNLFSSSSLPKSKSVGLSNKQVETLINELNKVRFRKATALEIENRQIRGMSNSIWLVVSDEMGRDQFYISEIRADYLSPDYVVFENYLYSLQKQKFPDGTGLWLNQYVPFTSSSFESLTLDTSGGIAGSRSILRVRKLPTAGNPYWSHSTDGKEFSNDENLGPRGTWSFFHALYAVNLPFLNGKSYKQRNLVDGFNEVLTVTLNDGRKFTFSNYGDQAPKEYSAFRKYLNGFALEKASHAQ